MPDCLIRFEHVSFGYGPDRPVLERCSFCLESGQRIALLGANGSGKTTLLHLVVGLLKPNDGKICAFGAERIDESDFADVRRQAGLVFQDADDQLFCPTVEEDVAFGPLNLGRPRPEVRQIVAETLSTLGLEAYAHRITHRLSGGEKRLVALATVLAMQPKVLLLDEPTAGLDEAATERLLEVLRGLQQAMLIASHDRPFLDRLATDAWILRGGRVEPISAVLPGGAKNQVPRVASESAPRLE
ncbi:MAG: energy-coupling factor ABC transporter ATP-binding protein [Planctomycetota bacterium]